MKMLAEINAMQRLFVTGRAAVLPTAGGKEHDARLG